MTLGAHNLKVSQHRSPAAVTGYRANSSRASGAVAVQPTPAGNPFPPAGDGKLS
jgi:hypothetical protein